MSHPTAPSSGNHYDPVPLTTDHHTDESYSYSNPTPPSPSHNPTGLSPYDPLDDLPPARPRFFGPAAGHPDDPRIRDSIASSQFLGGSHSENSSVYALNRPLAADASVPALDRYRDDPFGSTPALATDVPLSQYGAANPAYVQEKRAAYPSGARRRSKRRIFIIAGLVAAVLLALAIAIPVYFTVGKKDSKPSKGSASSGDDPSPSNPSDGTSKGSHAALAVTGGDGSSVTMDDGTKFTYANAFGGYWYYDAKDPFNNGAKPNSWTPALNETFNYGVDKIWGVNLGGWLNTEPFIVPALYEPYINNAVPAIDEYTLSQAMASDTARGGMKQLEQHYETFITEKDFAEIAGAGLNFIRLPIAYWAIETRDNEPFLAKTSWTYVLKAIQWARKYGLRVNLDLHAVPGSQNGWNHSGRLGGVNWLNGPMGYANAQRTLDYIRIIAEFISQPQYSDVVVMFGIINEPQAPILGQDNLSRFYLEAYNIVRQASGQGKGPIVSFHDGFQGLEKWANFLPGADRIALDYHPYLCFGGQPKGFSMDDQVTRPCDVWGAQMNKSMSAFGLTGAGEFSNAASDCGLFVNGVNLGTRYEGNYTESTKRVGSCEPWTDWQKWDADFKKSVQQFAMASMDALQNFFFWNWKIGASSVSGKVESPAWSYQLGLENGWMPKDPRVALGTCGNKSPWTGALQPGSGTVDPDAAASFAWPPSSINHAGALSLLPSYTQTGPVPTLPAPTLASGVNAKVGNGWNNAADSAGMYVPVATCSYLDPWVGESADPPSPLCAGAARRAYPPSAFPAPTPPPVAA